jgi:hypothetical protein
MNYPYKLLGLDERGRKIAEFGGIPTHAMAKKLVGEWLDQFGHCVVPRPAIVRIVRCDGYGTEDDRDLFSTKLPER